MLRGGKRWAMQIPGGRVFQAEGQPCKGCEAGPNYHGQGTAQSPAMWVRGKGWWGGERSHGALSPISLRILSYKVILHSSFWKSRLPADNQAERAGTWVRQVRRESAKFKETLNLRCQVRIYMSVRISTSLNFAWEMLHLPHSSPSPDAENSCSVYLSTKQAGISRPHTHPHAPPPPPHTHPHLCQNYLSCKCTIAGSKAVPTNHQDDEFPALFWLPPHPQFQQAEKGSRVLG